MNHMADVSNLTGLISEKVRKGYKTEGRTPIFDYRCEYVNKESDAIRCITYQDHKGELITLKLGDRIAFPFFLDPVWVTITGLETGDVRDITEEQITKEGDTCYANFMRRWLPLVEDSGLLQGNLYSSITSETFWNMTRHCNPDMFLGLTIQFAIDGDYRRK
jgi:hypothetical protein